MNMDPRSSALFGLVADDLLAASLYRSPHLIPTRIAASGAVSINAEWEAGRSETWFIEMQRFGAELVQAGVVCRRDDWIERGLEIVEWGLARQGPGGDFPGTGDPYHSTELFLEGAARSLLLLSQEGNAGPAVDVRQRWVNHIRFMAAWLLRPDIASAGRSNNDPFVHRRWIMAAALLMASVVTGDGDFRRGAEEHAEEGLQLQRADGVNLERGGFDVNYQSAGLLFAARCHAVCDDASLRGRIADMIRRGLGWLTAKMDERGSVSAAGSTRVGKENLRSGAVKSMNDWELMQTLCYGATITGDDGFREAARRLAQNAGPLKPDQLL